MRAALLGLLLAAPALAGCLSPDDVGAAGLVPPAAALPDGLVVHTPNGTAALPEGVPLVEPLLLALGASTFEPTLGVAPDGAIYYSVTSTGVALGAKPGVLKSTDGGVTWTDVSPSLPTGHGLPPETNDPYVYVDPATGRVFQFAMAPILVCGWLSWSDDGGSSWLTNPRGCGNTPPWDHQSMVAAPPVGGVPMPLYPNALYQCVNNLVAVSCARSLDGGASWVATAPAQANTACGGLHGHLVGAADGTLFVPKDDCGVSIVLVTRDMGATWEQILVSDLPTQAWSDPAMAIDDAGNVYYAFVDDVGRLMLSVSRDNGATWSPAIAVSPPGLTTHIPAIAAGAEGHVVFAYPATADLPEGYQTEGDAVDNAAWHAYLTVTTNALGAAPILQTTRATSADDPLVRGACGPARCPAMTDFIDVVIGPDGTPFAAFADACTGACAEGKEGNNANEAILVTLGAGPALR